MKLKKDDRKKDPPRRKLTVNERIDGLEKLVGQLQHNDNVTQAVCKAILQAVTEITERLNKLDPPPS